MKKILIIEDEEDILDNIKTLLVLNKFKVYTATDGEKGLIIVKNYLPDLIISDIMLPGIDGYEVFEKINKNENTSHIPFIFLTAKVDRKDLRKGMELGADDYIFKPFDNDELLKAINTRLKKHDAIKEKIIHLLTHAPAHKANVKLKNEDKIFVTHNRTTLPITINQITYIQSENQYSKISCENSKSYIVRKPLNDWINILPDNSFIRIHRTTIVNVKYIKSLQKDTNNRFTVNMNDSDCHFIVSRSYTKQLKNLIRT